MRFINRLLIAGLLFSIASCTTTPPPTSRAAHEQRIRAAEQAEVQHDSVPISPEIVALRTRLIAEYRQLVASVYSDYHGIYADMVGYTIYAGHPLFGGSEFSAGPLTPAVRQWIITNGADLQKADVRCLGIMSVQGLALIQVGPNLQM